MISNNIISEDDGEDYLDNLKKSMSEEKPNNQLASPIEPFTEDENIDNITSALDTAPQTLPTPPLQTPGINENLLAKAPVSTGINATGLTPTELGLLSPEEQAIRLRQRGMA